MESVVPPTIFSLAFRISRPIPPWHRVAPPFVRAQRGPAHERGVHARGSLQGIRIGRRPLRPSPLSPDAISLLRAREAGASFLKADSTPPWLGAVPQPGSAPLPIDPATCSRQRSLRMLLSSQRFPYGLPGSLRARVGPLPPLKGRRPAYYFLVAGLLVVVFGFNALLSTTYIIFAEKSRLLGVTVSLALTQSYLLPSAPKARWGATGEGRTTQSMEGRCRFSCRGRAARFYIIFFRPTCFERHLSCSLFSDRVQRAPEQDGRSEARLDANDNKAKSSVGPPGPEPAHAHHSTARGPAPLQPPVQRRGKPTPSPAGMSPGSAFGTDRHSAACRSLIDGIPEAISGLQWFFEAFPGRQCQTGRRSGF